MLYHWININTHPHCKTFRSSFILFLSSLITFQLIIHFVKKWIDTAQTKTYVFFFNEKVLHQTRTPIKNEAHLEILFPFYSVSFLITEHTDEHSTKPRKTLNKRTSPSCYTYQPVIHEVITFLRHPSKQPVLSERASPSKHRVSLLIAIQPTRDTNAIQPSSR